MLASLERREVSTGGLGETNAFSIKANGKAFKVLIDGLYSNKIKAVIRELWTNAYDSHVAAGREGWPFDCQLPSTFDPVFRVRDYGTSLAHDDVMHLYTTVFASSKEDTNTQVGKLGLGSKSPFAYTDTFTVTTWLDAVKRTYAAWIGENYVPQIALVSVEETSEDDGLEVQFPVKSSDVSDFVYAANEVSEGFDVKPNVTGNHYYKPRTVEPLLTGDGWRLCRSGEHAKARQGCVVYPIDASAVVNAPDTVRSLLRAAIFIDFPIGELEITASRESLGYDATTSANIVARLSTIHAEVVSGLENKLNNECETYWEAQMFLHDLEKSGLPREVIQALRQRSFRGIPLSGASLHIDRKRIRANDIYMVEHRHRGWAQSLSKRSHRTGLTVNFARLVKVYVCPPSIRIQEMWARVRTHLVDQRISHNIQIVRTAAMARVVVAMGRPPEGVLIDVSTLPASPKERRAGGVYKAKARVARYHAVKDWPEVEIDLNLGGIYVPLSRVDYAPGSGYSGFMVSVMREHFGYTIYGLPAALIKKAAKTGKWRALVDVLREKIDEHSTVIGARLAAARAVDAQDYPAWLADPKLNVISSGEFAEARQQIRDLQGMSRMPPDLAALAALADRVGHRPWEHAEAQPVYTVPTMEDIYTRYPMLELIGGEINQRMAKIVTDYVSQIDAA